MTPIYYDLPNLSPDQVCTPSSTLNQYYCFYNRNGNNTYNKRATVVFLGDRFDVSVINDGYGGYDISNYTTHINKVEMFPELSRFWFPLISIFCVFLIFLFVYRIMFRRFIK